MKNSQDLFRVRLLANEPWDSPSRERYEQAVKDLVARKLTPIQRWSFSLLAVVLVPMAVLFLWLAASQSQLPMLARIFLIESTLFTIIMIVYIARVVMRGEFHRRRMPTFVTSLMWVFAVLLSIHFIALIPFVPNPVIAVYFLGMAMLSMIGSGLQLLLVRIEQSELNMHERMLETFYRLTDGTHKSDASKN